MQVKQALRFTGKISWEGRENGLPEFVYQYSLFADFNKEQINALLEQENHQHMHDQGMHVSRDQGQIIDLSQIPQDRMFVPMKWIVCIRPDIITFNPELSLPDADGVERFSDGSEPKVQ